MAAREDLLGQTFGRLTVVSYAGAAKNRNFEQANNKRTNILFEKDGETHTLPGWARKLGVSKATLYSRYYRGWSTEEILR